MQSADTNNHNISGYDTWSSFYDVYPNPTVALDEIHFPPWWRDIREKKVFELGCGTGRHTAKLALNGNDVTAVDFSAGMIRKAMENIRSENIRFIHADFFTEEGFGNGYDAVIESLVLEHIEQPRDFFARVSEILLPGGDVFMSEIHPSRSSEGIIAHFKLPDGGEFRFRSYPHSSEKITSAAADTGFTLIRTREISGDKSMGKINPKWIRYDGMPMIQIWHFRKD
jgi:malonyl-CoA O-methyltransferase